MKNEPASVTFPGFGPLALLTRVEPLQTLYSKHREHGAAGSTLFWWQKRRVHHSSLFSFVLIYDFLGNRHWGGNRAFHPARPTAGWAGSALPRLLQPPGKTALPLPLFSHLSPDNSCGTMLESPGLEGVYSSPKNAIPRWDLKKKKRLLKLPTGPWLKFFWTSSLLRGHHWRSASPYGRFQSLIHLSREVGSRRFPLLGGAPSRRWHLFTGP